MTGNKAKRILILGGGGTLGHKIWQLLTQRNRDTYVSIRRPRSYYDKCALFNGPNVVDGLDLRDFSQLRVVLEDIRPSVIVNCAGVTLRSREAGDKKSNIAINALLPHELADWCGKQNSRLIHFSTACVFSGRVGGYTEDTTPDAQDLYGITKTLGDVEESCALTLRSSFIGREIFGGAELLEWFLAQEGQHVKGFRNAFFTGLTTNCLAELVSELIEDFPGLSGLYHVASETVSKFELLNMMKEAYALDVEIEPDEQFECRRNLNGDRFMKATGFKCLPWRQMMFDMAADQTPYDQWR